MPRRRRPLRPLDDLPSLWDNIDINDNDHVNDKGYASDKNVAHGDIANDIVSDTEAVYKPLDRSVSANPTSADFIASTTPLPEFIFISFGSGSSGNSAFIGIRGVGGVIVDAGIDPNLVFSTLRSNAIPVSQILGIIITHDHSDHVRFAYPLLRRLHNVAIYSTIRALEGMLRRHSISRRIKDYHKPIFKENEFMIGPLTITPFEVSHDGTDNVGFSISCHNRNFVVATDMGVILDSADRYIRKANYLMIEANYDSDMLASGRYPEYLKARIRSAKGHLDNSITADYLANIWSPHLTDIYLCHLSQDNNKPEIALNTVIQRLTQKGINVIGQSQSLFSSRADVRLSVLPRFDASPLFIHRIKD